MRDFSSKWPQIGLDPFFPKYFWKIAISFTNVWQETMHWGFFLEEGFFFNISQNKNLEKKVKPFWHHFLYFPFSQYLTNFPFFLWKKNHWIYEFWVVCFQRIKLFFLQYWVTQIDLRFLRLKGKERGGPLTIFEISLKTSK